MFRVFRVEWSRIQLRIETCRILNVLHLQKKIHMWTPEGQAKSVHVSDLSTALVTLYMVHTINQSQKQCPRQVNVHVGVHKERL